MYAAAVIVALIILVVWAASAARRNGRSPEDTRPVRSRVDGLPYRVHLTYEDAGRAADALATINARATEVLRRLRASADPCPSRRAAARRLLLLYNPDNLVESAPDNPDGETSYTVAKGAVIALCLRSAGGELHDLETLMFVALHEMTHVAVAEQGHPPAFWRTFKWLLEEARDAGVISGDDYSRAPKPYCGMEINYSPLHDADLIPACR